MNTRRIAAAVIATAAWFGAFGLLGESEANAAQYSPSHSDTVYYTDSYYSEWSHCTSDQIGWLEPVFIADDGSVYGDQDSNGVIDGDDCNWR